MTNIQKGSKFKPLRTKQNIGKVLISKKLVLKKKTNAIFCQNFIDFIVLDFSDPMGGPPIGPYLANKLFFAHTGIEAT